MNDYQASTWKYSNAATSLAAYLVEVAFKEYAVTKILQPLGMTQTAYDLADLDAANIAQLYWDKKTPLPLYNNDSYPDAGIKTCNEDLAK